jgi:hypothetical protein
LEPNVLIPRVQGGNDLQFRGRGALTAFVLSSDQVQRRNEINIAEGTADSFCLRAGRRMIRTASGRGHSRRRPFEAS